MKALLRDHGVHVPEQQIIGLDLDQIAAALTYFGKQNIEFVVKGNSGFGGKNVKLFSPEEFAEAASFAKNLIERNIPVYVEKRIVPLEWKDPQGVLLDWNIRTLVTLSADPIFIDAEVRYRPYGFIPVNVCQGAKIEEVDVVAKQTGLNEKNIVDISLQIARAYYASLPNPAVGILGCDIIPSMRGDVTLEVSSGYIGGFGSLLKHRKRIFKSPGKFFESIKDTLAQRYAQRKSTVFHSPLPRTKLEFAEIAKMHRCHGETILAEINYRSALLLDPDSEYVLESIALLKREEGRLEDALTYYQRLIKISQNLEKYLKIGTLFREMARHNEALQSFHEAEKLNPNNEHIHFLLGLTLAELKKYSSAVTEFKKAIELNPHVTASHVNLGNCYSHNRNYPEAIKAYEEALKLEQAGYIYFNLGICYSDSGDHQQAVQNLKRAVVLNPQDINTHSMLGREFRKLGQHDEAIESFWHAVILDPHKVEYYCQIGFTYNKMGLMKQAEVLYRDALALDNDHLLAKIGLNMCKLGLFYSQQNQRYERLMEKFV